MDILFLIFGVAVFVAVALGVEGAYLLWSSRRGPEARRLERRLRAVSAGGHGNEPLNLLKQRSLATSPGLHRLLLSLPRVRAIDRLIVQSGLSLTVAELFGLSALCASAGLIAMLWLGQGLLLALIIALLLAAAPSGHVLRARRQRMNRIESQLPDAIDLMGRALRAGHALPTALKMAGDEMPEPIGSEFRTLFDEVNYGIALPDALRNLLARVPGSDVQYFVVALLIQRETGGNLAELLDNISGIVRSRLKLLGEVRTLSAEGRLSAWILGLLPFAAGLLINLVNPGFLKVLWTDPTGLRLVYSALAMMVGGVWWMSRIVKIRV